MGLHRVPDTSPRLGRPPAQDRQKGRVSSRCLSQLHECQLALQPRFQRVCWSLRVIHDIHDLTVKALNASEDAVQQQITEFIH